MFIASARSAAWSLYRVQFIRVYVVEDRMSDARARAPCRRDVSPFASRDNELLCPVGRLLFGSRDVAMEIRETLLLSFFLFFFSIVCALLCCLGKGNTLFDFASPFCTRKPSNAASCSMSYVSTGNILENWRTSNARYEVDRWNFIFHTRNWILTISAEKGTGKKVPMVSFVL